MSESDDDIDSPSPLDENIPIDFSLVYALHTFVATLEGQVCVIRGDNLQLLDDSNSYWWLVKCVKTDEIGYIPAENIETPYERLARLNRQRNSRPSDLIAESPRKAKTRLKIKFAARPMIIYQDGEMESGLYCDQKIIAENEEDLAAATEVLNQEVRKTKALSLRDSFRTLLKISSSKKSNSDISLISKEDLTKLAEPINVLRIFAGNIDLKATFKTVAISKNMIISDLIDSALKKFRVENSSQSEYYISVLHMDSQERRIPETDLVIDLVDSLRHRCLPGVGDFSKISHARMKKGQISSVRMNDDNIIKIIINKKLNLFDKNLHLMRVFMYDESVASGSMRLYKTIGVDSSATVDTVISISIKKFKLETEGWTFTLRSLLNDEEVIRTPLESIKSILMLAKKSIDDIDFILCREWVGVGGAPVSGSLSAHDTSQDMRIYKPSFLNERDISVESIFVSATSLMPVLSNIADDPSDLVLSAPPRKVSLAAHQNAGSDSTNTFGDAGMLPELAFEGFLDEDDSNAVMEEYAREVLKPKMNSGKVDQLESILMASTMIKRSQFPVHSIHSEYSDSGLALLAQSMARSQSLKSEDGSSVRISFNGSYEDGGLSNLLSIRKTPSQRPSLGKVKSWPANLQHNGSGATTCASQRSIFRGLFDEIDAAIDLHRVESNGAAAMKKGSGLFEQAKLAENTQVAAEKELDVLLAETLKLFDTGLP